MYEKEFTQIINASKSNSLSFFVGAGISRLSGAPSWAGLINTISEKMNRPQKADYSYDEFLKIPQMYYYSLDNKNDYYSTVESEINVAGLEPNTIHREMLSLDPASFITTNYDTLIEDAAEKYCQSFKAISSDSEVPSISGDRYILKIHGDFKRRKGKFPNFVLKEEDYLNYSENFKLIETLVKSIFSTNTVVFIGYRLGDYNIMLILNWAKELLKDDFRKPIFLYSDDDELAEEELRYHQSKGVTVVEWQKILKNNDASFEERYLSFFKAIRDYNKIDYLGDNPDEAFLKLFYILKPLDSLKALRHEDVRKKLADNNLFIESNGIVRLINDNSLFSKFVEIDKLSLEERNALDPSLLDMYDVISSVLKKACIGGIRLKKEVYLFKSSITELGDSHCILYDYKWMSAYVKKDYKKLDKLFYKAFYLYKLYRFEESLRLFTEVSRRAFKEENYLLFYFAKANCISLRQIIKNPNRLLFSGENGIEDDLLNSAQIDNLFNGLPYKFKLKYDNLKDIHSSSLLYKYAYYAFESAHKVDEVIENNTIEYGISACDKAIYRVNDFMHFMLGNGLVVDAFIEYKNAVKRIMESLIHKYAIQNKREVLVAHILPSNNETIYFDEIDYYCFIECFKAKEISRLLDNNKIETLEFKNRELIEQTIRNIFEYYIVAKKEQVEVAELLNLQLKIQNVLMLSRYMDLSQDLVEFMTEFILENKFREILIDDKVYFLDRQIYKRKKQSRKTVSTIEKCLFSYFDEHKQALESESQFEDYSKAVGITYANLANYLMLNGEDYISLGLSRRVKDMIEKDYLKLFSRHYYNHVGKTRQKQLLRWIEQSIEKNFDFKRLCFLISYDYKMTNDTIIYNLVDYLKQEREADSQERKVFSLPVSKKYESIIQVGYWCLLGIVDTSYFKEFYGFCDEFDFYYNPDDFSYEKFDVRWLFGMRDVALDKLAEDEERAAKIRNSIALSVRTNDFSNKDNDRLKKILVDHFC